MPKPNILLVMSDQHNPHVMGCAGDPVVKTPHLDALAGRGVLFDSLYCPSPLCVPSRMGFMAGQYPSEVDVWSNGSVLSSGVPTFAHGLNAAGYETVLCGRMHFRPGSDQYHGFEKRIFGDCHNYISQPLRGGEFHKTTGQTKYAVEVSGFGRSGYTVYDEQVTERACRFLKNREGESRPFAMVVGYIQPHNPLVCSKELFEYYMDALPEPELPPEGFLEALQPGVRKWRERRGCEDLTVQQRTRGRAAYYGLVTHLDGSIGRLMDGLEEAGHADDTVIIYTSDHGDMCAEQYGMWWKSNFFEGAARVPFIASFPKEISCGGRSNIVASLVDVGPTVLDLAQADPLPDVTGRSFARTLRGQENSEWADVAYSEFLGAWGDEPSCMIRRGPWKLMYYSEFDSYLLFNLDEDPYELADRSKDPECRKIGSELLGKIQSRWSAKQALSAAEAEARRNSYLNAARNPEGQEPFIHPSPVGEINEFDFSQVPGWEGILARAKASGEWYG